MTARLYHWRDGLCFERTASGDVWVERRSPDLNVVSEVLGLIPAAEWSSIVATMSRRGETAETHAAALRFHTEAPDGQG